MSILLQTLETSNVGTATATIVQSFLPVMDEFNALREPYQDDVFGTKYLGLVGAMNAALKSLGVEEFSVEAGSSTPPVSRVTVVGEEPSEEFEKGAVIRTVKAGMELDGNVMRMAEVVVSSGAVNEEKEEAQDQVEVQE